MKSLTSPVFESMILFICFTAQVRSNEDDEYRACAVQYFFEDLVPDKMAGGQISAILGYPRGAGEISYSDAYFPPFSLYLSPCKHDPQSERECVGWSLHWSAQLSSRIFCLTKKAVDKKIEENTQADWNTMTVHPQAGWDDSYAEMPATPRRLSWPPQEPRQGSPWHAGPG